MAEQKRLIQIISYRFLQQETGNEPIIGPVQKQIRSSLYTAYSILEDALKQTAIKQLNSVPILKTESLIKKISATYHYTDLLVQHIIAMELITKPIDVDGGGFIFVPYHEIIVAGYRGEAEEFAQSLKNKIQEKIPLSNYHFFYEIIYKTKEQLHDFNSILELKRKFINAMPYYKLENPVHHQRGLNDSFL